MAAIGLHRLRGMFLTANGAAGQKLRLRFAKPSESHGSAEVYFTGRNELKQPTQNTAAKKTARWESTGSDYLFAKFEYMVRPEI